MDRLKTTPKDFFLWAGAMVALYVSVFSLITLYFEYINYTFPDALQPYVDPYSGAIRFAMASLIVLFPVFLLLMRLIRNDIVRTPEKRDLWIRRWALFLTVFVAGTAIAIDLITLINYFLGGDLTTRFVLKVVVVLLVAGAGLMHFLADIWGHWLHYPERARMVGLAAGILILLSIAAGFFIMGTPGQIRLYRFDDQKVSDLQNIQWQIVSYWQQKKKLPATLAELQDPISGFNIPTNPQTGEPYRYEREGVLSFTLCATFNAENRSVSTSYPMARPAVPMGIEKGKGVEDNWQHGAGETCFERTIDPDRYPPLNK